MCVCARYIILLFYHIISYDIVLNHILFCTKHIILYYIILCYMVLYCITLNYTTP